MGVFYVLLLQHGLEGVLEALAPLRGYINAFEVHGAHWWRGAEAVKLGQVFGGSGLTTLRLVGSALRGFSTFWEAVPAMVTRLPDLATLELDNVGIWLIDQHGYNCCGSTRDVCSKCVQSVLCNAVVNAESAQQVSACWYCTRGMMCWQQTGPSNHSPYESILPESFASAHQPHVVAPAGAV
jgi:hypothetical protein